MNTNLCKDAFELGSRRFFRNPQALCRALQRLARCKLNTQSGLGVAQSVYLSKREFGRPLPGFWIDQNYDSLAVGQYVAGRTRQFCWISQHGTTPRSCKRNWGFETCFLLVQKSRKGSVQFNEWSASAELPLRYLDIPTEQSLCSLVCLENKTMAIHKNCCSTADRKGFEYACRCYSVESPAHYCAGGHCLR